jgi:hypothetical protein
VCLADIASHWTAPGPQPRSDDHQVRRLGGVDSGVKFGSGNGFSFGSVHAGALLASREAQSLGGFRLEGVCLSPNASYLIRKPTDDKSISLALVDAQML